LVIKTVVESEMKKYNKKEEKIKNYLSDKENLRKLGNNLVLYKQRPTQIIGSLGKINEINIPTYDVPEFDFGNDKPDIICFDEIDSDIVIVEIKSKHARHEVFGQILCYMTWAKKNIRYANGKEVNTVKGIILAHKIHPSLTMLVEEYENMLPKIDLKTYHWTTHEKELIIEGTNHSFLYSLKSKR